MTSIWQTLNDTLAPSDFFAVVEETLDGLVSIVDELVTVTVIFAVVGVVIIALKGGVSRILNLIKM